jgi:hypothetical protein
MRPPRIWGYSEVGTKLLNAAPAVQRILIAPRQSKSRLQDRMTALDGGRVANGIG